MLQLFLSLNPKIVKVNIIQYFILKVHLVWVVSLLLYIGFFIHLSQRLRCTQG